MTHDTDQTDGPTEADAAGTDPGVTSPSDEAAKEQDRQKVHDEAERVREANTATSVGAAPVPEDDGA